MERRECLLDLYWIIIDGVYHLDPDAIDRDDEFVLDHTPNILPYEKKSNIKRTFAKDEIQKARQRA
ncbi:MAG: hypothetical protein AB1652_09825, partial [Bacillota bacterium]